jgi:V-type H+-transporting ATPase subunit a
MMFGDMGHGSIVLAAGLILVLFNDRLKKTAVAPVLFFRYMLLMMGFFAFYCGLIYNEWFALPTFFFPTCFSESREMWNPKIDT